MDMSAVVVKHVVAPFRMPRAAAPPPLPPFLFPRTRKPRQTSQEAFYCHLIHLHVSAIFPSLWTLPATLLRENDGRCRGWGGAGSRSVRTALEASFCDHHAIRRSAQLNCPLPTDRPRLLAEQAAVKLDGAEDTPSPQSSPPHSPLLYYFLPPVVCNLSPRN